MSRKEKEAVKNVESKKAELEKQLRKLNKEQNAVTRNARTKKVEEKKGAKGKKQNRSKSPAKKISKKISWKIP